MAKIIFRLQTNDMGKHRNFMEKFEADAVTIPEDVRILIKDRDGYWREI